MSAAEDSKKHVLDKLNLNRRQNRLWDKTTTSTAKIEVHEVVKAGLQLWSETPEEFFHDSSFDPKFSHNFLRGLHLFGSRSDDQIALSKVRQRVLAVAIHHLKEKFCHETSAWTSLLDQVISSLNPPDQTKAEDVHTSWSKWAKLGSRLAGITDDIGSNGVLLVLPDDISDTK